jgi:isocitrate lyase
MLLIARTDSEAGKLISSTVDMTDHEFIKGTTTPASKSLAQVIQEAEASGKSGKEIDQLEAAWMASHELVTFAEGELQSLQVDVISHETLCSRQTGHRRFQHLRQDSSV